MGKARSSLLRTAAFRLLGLFTLGLLLSGNKEARAADTADSPPPGLPVLDAVRLADAYDSNELAADERYKGKTLRVTGQISEIGKDLLDKPFIVLAGMDVRGVQCLLVQDSVRAAAAVSKGARITVKGECEGLMMNVILNECAIEKTPSVPVPERETQLRQESEKSSEAGVAKQETADRCRPPAYPRSPESLEQCASQSIPDECLSTGSMRDYISEVTHCVERFMNQQLDRRLFALKKSDTAQFRKEMRIQADFNKAAEVECDKHYACGGTAALLNGDGCHERYITYRARQARTINSGALELSSVQKRAQPAWSGEARAFARGLCSMPLTIWKDKKIPADCEQLVLLDMESAKLAPDGDPCGT